MQDPLLVAQGSVGEVDTDSDDDDADAPTTIPIGTTGAQSSNAGDTASEHAEAIQVRCCCYQLPITLVFSCKMD